MKKTLIVGLIILVFLIIGVWYVAIPLELINNKIKDAFHDEGLRVEIEGIKKGVFFSISIDRISFYRSDGTGEDAPFFVLSHVETKLNFLSLLRLSPNIKIKGACGEGRISGEFFISKARLDLKLRDLRVSSLKFLNEAGIYGEGRISAELSIFLKEKAGQLTFHASQVKLKDMTNNGLIPLSLFDSIRGFMKLDNKSLEIHSLSFEGKGIYGRVRDSKLRLEGSRLVNVSGSSNIELMINSDFSMPHLVEFTLMRYRKSPGYYVIPLGKEF